MGTVNSAFEILVNKLSKAEAPQTCLHLFEDDEIKTVFETSTKLSNTLGYLWRRGHLKRHTAPYTERGGKSRYAYSVNASRPLETTSAIAGVSSTATSVHLGGKVEIDEAARSVTIKTKEFTVTYNLK